MIKLVINTANAAFGDEGKGIEAARIIEEAADKMENGQFDIKLYDSNGNVVGSCVEFNMPFELVAGESYITLEMKTDNAAFEDNDKCFECARILRGASAKIRDGEMSFKLRDVNGNTVGKVEEVGGVELKPGGSGGPGGVELKPVGSGGPGGANLRPDASSLLLAEKAAGPGLYEELKAAGVRLDHHESDLYFPVNAQTQKILARYPLSKSNSTVFHSNVDGEIMFDVPFGYAPAWEKRMQPYNAPSSDVGPSTWLVDRLPHELTSAEFSEIARAVKLENHGRQWEVFFGEKSLWFCDSPTASGALNEAHKREVNNALYSNSPDAAGFMKKLSMPADRVLVEYPELRERFADVLKGFAENGVLDQSFSRATVGPSYAIGQKFEFKPGDQIVGNGYRGTVQERYSGEVGQPGGMVNVRLPGGVGCISASFPDCYPAVSNGVEVVTEGRHSGKVVEVTDQFVTQDIGRGKLVGHPVGKFDAVPQVGEEIDVQYKGDKAVIVSPKVKSKGNER